MYHANVNVRFMVENVIQIKSGITINLDTSVKNIGYVKRILFRILLHVVAEVVNIYQVLLTISVIRSYKTLEEAKPIPTNFNEKKEALNSKFLYFTCIFINYHYIIDSCHYLLFSNKISSKTKRIITILHHK